MYETLSKCLHARSKRVVDDALKIVRFLAKGPVWRREKNKLRDILLHFDGGGRRMGEKE